MKLYATIKSERATKGQGGKYLDIEIMGDNKMVIARIKVSSSYPYQYDMDIFPVVYPEFSQGSAYKLNLDVKGHGYILKRKDTKAKNTRCWASISQYPEADRYCNNKATNGQYCKKHAEEFGETKAKRQKGEQCYCSESGLSIPHYTDDH